MGHVSRVDISSLLMGRKIVRLDTCAQYTPLLKNFYAFPDSTVAVPLDFARWGWLAEKWRVTSYHKRNFSKHIAIFQLSSPLVFPILLERERERKRTFSFQLILFHRGQKVNRETWFYSGIGNSWNRIYIFFWRRSCLGIMSYWYIVVNLKGTESFV